MPRKLPPLHPTPPPNRAGGVFEIAGALAMAALVAVSVAAAAAAPTRTDASYMIDQLAAHAARLR
jgi:hypothetical protein